MRTRTQAPPIRQHVAANVRAELARAGVSQAVAASWIGVTQPAMSARLHARVPFTVDEIAAIAAGLDLPVTALFAPPPTSTYVDPFLPPARGEQRNLPTSNGDVRPITGEYVRDWSRYLSNGAEPTFTDADWEEITAYLTGVLA